MSSARRPGSAWVARVTLGEPMRLEPGSAAREAALLASTPATSLLLDGVLYNGAELARALGIDQPGSDAKLLALAYERWGESLLPRLRGEFVLAVSDTKRGVVLLVRDPMGVYPLYYASVGHDLLLATAVDALLQHAFVPRDVSALGLAEFLWQRLPLLDETCFDSVRRVPAGHLLRARGGGVSVSRYWQPEVEPVGRDTALERFAFLVEQAVERTTQGRRAGILLSGGTDSATVAAAAGAVSRSRGTPAPIAVSLDAPASPYREREQQEHFADALSLPLVTLRFDDLVRRDAVRFAGLKWARRLSRPLGEPLMGIHIELLEAASTAGAAVVLTGHGGDEWFGLSPYFAADCIRRLDLLDLYRFWRARQDWFGHPALRSTLWTVGIRPLLRRLRPRRSPLPLPSWLTPEPALAAELKDRDEHRRRVRPASLSEAREATLNDPLTALVHENHFEESLLLGMPVRSPILDADLVVYLNAASPMVLLMERRVKGLARAYLGSRLKPEELPSLRQVSAPGVWEAFIDRELESLASYVGGFESLVRTGLVDERLGRLVGEPRTLLQEVGAVSVWRLFSAEIWLRAWADNWE